MIKSVPKSTNKHGNFNHIYTVRPVEYFGSAWINNGSPVLQKKGSCSSHFMSPHLPSCVSHVTAQLSVPLLLGMPGLQYLKDEVLLSDHFHLSLNRPIQYPPDDVPPAVSLISWFSVLFRTLTRSVCLSLQYSWACLQDFPPLIRTYDSLPLRVPARKKKKKTLLFT